MDNELDRAGIEPEEVALHTANTTPATGSGEYHFGRGSFEAMPTGAARTYSFTRNPQPQDPGAESFRPSPIGEAALPRAAAEPVRPFPVEAAAAAQAAEPVRPVPMSGAESRQAAVPPVWAAYQAGYAAPWPGYPYPGWGDPRRYETLPARPKAAPARTKKQSAKKKKQKKSAGIVWAVVAVALALLLGLIGGALGYQALHPTGSNRGNSVTPTNGGADPAQSSAPSQIYRQYANAVVSVSSEAIAGDDGATPSVGTGFIISEDGYILTNYHVIRDPASRIQVALHDGTVYPATLIGFQYEGSDAALLKIDAANLTPVELGDSDTVEVGEPVCTIGNPLGDLTNSLTAGYVSAKERTVNTDGNSVSMIQTDVAMNNGNSGGPLFDFSGKVVGIVTTKYSGAASSGASIEGLGFALPINAVMDLVKTWMST